MDTTPHRVVVWSTGGVGANAIRAEIPGVSPLGIAATAPGLLSSPDRPPTLPRAPFRPA